MADPFLLVARSSRSQDCVSGAAGRTPVVRQSLPTRRAASLIAAAVVASQLPGTALAQDAGEPAVLEGITVFSAGRRSERIEDVPQSVLVLEGESLKRQLEGGNTLVETLGALIPSYSPPDPIVGGGNSNTLRGREPLVLLDGIPLAFTSNFGQFLNTVDPGIIDRVEVIYGPSALYGQGAGGGVIQLFTKNPSLDFEGSVGARVHSFLTESNAFDRDGTSLKGTLTASDSVGRFGYFGHLSFEDRGGVQRSDGLLTDPDRVQFAENVEAFVKLTVELTDASQLTLSGDIYESEQQQDAFDFATETTADGFRLAVPNPQPFTYSDPPSNDTLNANLIYDNEDVLGGIVRLQGFYRENRFLNPGSDIRAQVDAGLFPAEWPTIWQTGQDGSEWGARGEFTRNVTERIAATAGFDYTDETREGITVISDRDVFEATGALNGTSVENNTPPYELTSIGLFAQVDADITDRFFVTGGIRYDRFTYDIDPYDVLFNFGVERGLRPGGEGSEDLFSFNVGVGYDITPTATVFANYSEGLRLADVANAATRVQVGVPLPASEFATPIDVAAVDLGIRGATGRLSYAASAFYSESDLGDAIVVDAATGLGRTTRAPQRNYGFELAATFDATEALRVSGSLSWQEGEVDEDDDGDFVALSSREVPPPQVRLQADYKLNGSTSVFGRMHYSAPRDRAFDDGNDFFEPDAYALFDGG